MKINIIKQLVKGFYPQKKIELSTGVTILSLSGDKVVTPYIDIKKQEKELKKKKKKGFFQFHIGGITGNGVRQTFTTFCLVGGEIPFKAVSGLNFFSYARKEV